MYDDFSVGTAKVTKSVAYMLTLDLLINRAMDSYVVLHKYVTLL